MEGLEHTLGIVVLVNRLLGRPVASVLALFGVEVADPANCIPDYIIMVFIVAAAMIILFTLAGKKRELVPGKIQVVGEEIIRFFEGQIVEIVGPEGRKFTPVVGTVGLFILFSNLLGLIPGLMSPTAKLNVTIGCALAVFFYYHGQGFKAHGLKYLKHFVGPIPFIAPLMIPIELISHFSRVISLSIRLFSNIFAEEVLILVISSIVAIFLPLPFMALSIFTAFLQAFVFVLLTCIYLSGAVEEEEDHKRSSAESPAGPHLKEAHA